ncbi:hypothetical protein [Paractinoplanes durhamensis]|uniref:hypothetical protein n=1 Tax=Paractinoplanes durhamensis TaxID=113563 RepID=UPI001943B7E7|nr:hypothetical protein [Actinoplanes durhamensis]
MNSDLYSADVPEEALRTPVRRQPRRQNGSCGYFAEMNESVATISATSRSDA